ncbi:hypothetical protein GCM10007053_11510 [Halioglobus pacificus]|uniref:Uncharacterized protein n=1 Tax=Parahalioglobus pacificus TaxID=930806 RepID=A0A918XGU0_9GAMM|nr:hypothetical protein GCM10007053_11510 [Halioglobus pacificus]
MLKGIPISVSGTTQMLISGTVIIFANAATVLTPLNHTAVNGIITRHMYR